MKIAVVGGGASGMMAAASLLEFGLPPRYVAVFESNARLGKKVAITGGGRCNLTTALPSRKDVLSAYPRGAEFLDRPLGAFSPKKVREWFAGHGCPTYAQDDFRVFPASDDAEDVVGAFVRALSGADLRFGTRVGRVEKLPDGDFLVDGERFSAVVLATGGAAYSKTGSDGSGHALARSLGHSVTRLAPSLSAFVAAQPWCADLSGIPFPKSRFRDAEGRTLSDGAAMFAHFGVTGPAVFALSARTAFVYPSPENPLKVRFVPEFRPFETWDAELASAFSADGAKELKNVLSRYFPKRFSEILPEIAGVASVPGAKAAERKAATLSKDDRRALAKALSEGIPLDLVSTRPGEEFVTAGGVSTDEIDPETMESRLVPGLYVTGELLDVDAVTGWFNLQACWSTGRSAAKAISKKFPEEFKLA